MHHTRNVHVPEARLGALLPPNPLTGDSNFPEDVPEDKTINMIICQKKKKPP